MTGLRETQTYYDILVKIGHNEEVKQRIEVNSYGKVTDSIETKSFSLIRAVLFDGLVGEVLKIDAVLSIEKPVNISRETISRTRR